MRNLLGTLGRLLVWPGLYVPAIALLLLPGVLLHELSHALGALIAGHFDRADKQSQP